MKCQEFQNAAIASAAQPGELAKSALLHKEACAACADFWERIQLQGKLLSELPRVEAPQDLEGRVVAALHCGFREDRAVRHLSALPAVEAPSELDERIAQLLLGRLDPSAPGAPGVLDRLVEEDQADPAASLSKRMAGKLDRREAPPALTRRLEDLLEESRRRSRRRLTDVLVAPWAPLALAAGALILAWSGIGLFGQGADAKSYDFKVIEVTSIDDLGPMAESIAYTVAYGAVSWGTEEGR